MFDELLQLGLARVSEAHLGNKVPEVARSKNSSGAFKRLDKRLWDVKISRYYLNA